MNVGVHPVNVLSTCTGAGGLDLGVSLALGNARVVCCVEHEAYAIEVLASRMEAGFLDAAPIWTNLRTFDGKPWRGLVDLLIGGYPCQPFSTAGKRLGVDDPRHLWPEYDRLIDEIQPEGCFFENVSAHLSLGYFDVVKPSLEGKGYRVTEVLVSAEEIGAGHQRDRLFIMAYSGRERAQVSTSRGFSAVEIARADNAQLADTKGSFGRGGERGLELPRRGQDAKRSRKKLANADEHGREVEFGEQPGLESRRDTNGRIPFFPPGPDDFDTWRSVLAEVPAVEPAFCRMADGMAAQMDRRVQRLRLTGNGVVPAQAACAFVWLARELGFGE